MGEYDDAEALPVEQWYERLDRGGLAALTAIGFAWLGWRLIYSMALNTLPAITPDEPLLITVVIVPVLLWLHTRLPDEVRATCSTPLLAVVGGGLGGGAIAAITVGNVAQRFGWQDPTGKTIWAAVVGAILGSYLLLVALQWHTNYTDGERAAGRQPFEGWIDKLKVLGWWTVGLGGLGALIYISGQS